MRPDVLRQAKAIVYFRLLRSVGQFRRIPGTPHFVFRYCRCCAECYERIPNGLPSPVDETRLQDIVDEYAQELGPICRAHFKQER